MKPALATRSLVVVAVLATAVLSYWGGAKRLHALHVLNVEAAVPPSVRHAAARDASHPVVASGVEPAAKTEPAAPRVRLAELRAPLSETSDNDPFAVLSWLLLLLRQRRSRLHHRARLRCHSSISARSTRMRPSRRCSSAAAIGS